MTGCSPRRRQIVLLFALVNLVAFGSSATSADETFGPDIPTRYVRSLPTLTGAAPTSQILGTITVTGEAFTPEGHVYIALYDQIGAELYETRWITVSPIVYGQNGSQDPAAGFRRGGTFSEAFAHLCGATAMVRAYDRPTTTWSNRLDVAPGC